ncbi:MAG: hypothetical protein K9K66_08640 [Desulfarculaceae bacterium]|nr:hypothetical protein [Desulfarculaceae bacterium]MCF8071388.1 hypothetical protein [Desulfarculaceae bacterium]MCF8101713.1 hypothetical protein [Desulfarculaceae bacterium]MCF8116678.1 hypothetical protein [Desulfarculaceae bacterium]
MPENFQPVSPGELTRRVEAAQAAAQGPEPPAPAELAALLAACRGRAADNAALDLGARVVEIVLDLARKAGPSYLAALEGETS